MLGLSVAFLALARGLGWLSLSYPTLFSAGWGWCFGRWLSFAPCSRYCPLSGCASLRLRILGDSWFSPLCFPDRRSASRFTYPALSLSADCLLGLEPSPSGEASASSCRFSWTPGAAGALAVPSLRLRVSESSSLSAWSFPFRGLLLFLAFVPLLEALSESLTHSIPRSFLVVALSASAVGFADALWLCPERTLRCLFASVSLLAPVALSPLLHRAFPDGFRLWCAFRFCGGSFPLALVP